MSGKKKKLETVPAPNVPGPVENALNRQLDANRPESSTAVALVHPEVLDGESSALITSFDALLDATKHKSKFALLVKDERAVSTLVGIVKTFVAVDVNFAGGAKKLGQLIVNTLKQNQTEKMIIIDAICRANGIEPLKAKDGSNDATKAGLKWALFGRWPEMWKQSGKDTIAGKRFAYYIASASGTTRKKTRKEIGSGSESGPEPTEQTSTGAVTNGVPEPVREKTVSEAGKLWRLLYDHATDDGKRFLMALTSAAGVKYEDWLPSDVDVVRG